MRVAMFLFTEYKWCVRVVLCFYSQSTSGVCEFSRVCIHRVQGVCPGRTVFVWLYSQSTYRVVLDEVQLFVSVNLCFYLPK